MQLRNYFAYQIISLGLEMPLNELKHRSGTRYFAGTLLVRLVVLLLTVSCDQSFLQALQVQTPAASGQDSRSDGWTPQLSEDFPWTLSPQERAAISERFARALEISVRYENDLTSPFHITYAKARSVEIRRPVGISPLYVVEIMFRVNNNSDQNISALNCSLIRGGFEDKKVSLRIPRSIPAHGSRVFSMPSVASPEHLSRLPIVFTEPPAVLVLKLDGVVFEHAANREVAPPPEGQTARDLPAAPVELPQRIRVGKNLLQAHLVKRVNPIYPPRARESGIQGVVLLEVTIARNGDVAGVRLGNGHSLLIEAAQDVVRQWKYRPTFVNGQPVEVVAPVEVPFRLDLNQ